MLRPEVRPQIHNLPRAQRDQHAHSPKGKPLDSFVRALVRVPQFLLSHFEILHLVNNLIHILFDPPQLCIYWSKLFRGLNSRPVSCVGTDVNVEFYVAGGRVCCWERRLVLRQGTRGMRIHRPVMVLVKQTSNAVSAREVNAIRFSPVTSLGRPYSLPTASLIYGNDLVIGPAIFLVFTYVHINLLPITSVAVDGRGHNDKSILVDKVAYTSLLWSRLCLYFELEGAGQQW